MPRSPRPAGRRCRRSAPASIARGRRCVPDSCRRRGRRRPTCEDPMTTDHAELLSALIDREPVDPEALARALEDAEARRALVAFTTVRRALQAPAPGETEWIARPSRRRVASAGRDRWRLVAAAALLAAGLGAGIGAERYRSQQRPPEPTRVVQL